MSGVLSRSEKKVVAIIQQIADLSEIGELARMLSIDMEDLKAWLNDPAYPGRAHRILTKLDANRQLDQVRRDRAEKRIMAWSWNVEH